MIEFNIFPEEDTTIKLNLPTGKILEVDILDLDNLIATVHESNKSDKELSSIEFLTKAVDEFEKRYGIRPSRLSMDQLLGLKTELFSALKKNSFLPQEQ